MSFKDKSLEIREHERRQKDRYQMRLKQDRLRRESYHSLMRDRKNRGEFEGETMEDSGIPFPRGLVPANSNFRFKKRVFDSSFSIVILGLVLLVLGRFLFGSYNAETFDPSTVLPSILEGFANSSWSTEYLMFTLRNFSAIEGWAISSSGILQALMTLVAIIGYAGNFLMLLSALLLNAVQVIFLLFKLLFVPL